MSKLQLVRRKAAQPSHYETSENILTDLATDHANNLLNLNTTEPTL
jgi:hypothetical protein